LVIDPLTYERFIEAERAAKDKGLALIEALGYRRLLLTPQLEQEIAVKALEDALRRLELQSANRLMSFYHGRVDGTPAEMLSAAQQWLEAVCRNRAKGTLEDL
jgi:hypothetical protein